MRILPYVIAMLLLAPVAGFCDIAPTEFIGAGITPIEDVEIRMESADVHIEWGTPCLLSATFAMVNDSAVARTVTLGFPVPKPSFPTPFTPDTLIITFNEERAAVTGPFTEEPDSRVAHDWQWYQCRHEFHPGTTLVRVSTVLRASLVYATPFAESIQYCVRTGGKWAGRIGSEKITIQFPYAIDRDQISAAKPFGYKVSDKNVSWSFRKFEPVGDEFDIKITYIRPDAMAVIGKLRRDMENDPMSSDVTIKLAKHLLALGNEKSNSGFPPLKLAPNEFEEILRKIDRAPERKMFSQHYRRNNEGLFEETSSKWTKERESLVQILVDAGYRDEWSKVCYVTEGERLLLDLLKRDPHNAEAWNVYLANYWRFSFAAIGHWFGRTRLGKQQLAAIQKAAEECPEDECIRLWLEMVRYGDVSRRSDRLRQVIAEHGYLKVDFPNIEYDYY
jgi:hypothetical protein